MIGCPGSASCLPSPKAFTSSPCGTQFSRPRARKGHEKRSYRLSLNRSRHIHPEAERLNDSFAPGAKVGVSFLIHATDNMMHLSPRMSFLSFSLLFSHSNPTWRLRYTRGAWINWTDGAILGATITVSSRDGTLLISFVATFVTIVGAQLWRILSYMIHQIRSSREPQDGLHYQQQNILRNTASAGGAAWSFLKQAWYWRGKASMSILRMIPWTLFSVIYLVLFALLATFSSEVSKSAGRARLLRAGDCGTWVTDGDTSSDLAVSAYVSPPNSDRSAMSVFQKYNG